MSIDRRSFLQAGAITAASLALPRPVFGIGRPDADPIRIGLVGCGGRGTGAARDALAASENVTLVAMGDIFPDRLAKSREQLARVAAQDPAFAKKYLVTAERTFTGVDAYRQVLAADIDLVLLCTPPAFRPAHLEAAIAARKHVFMEKPVCVDVAGALSVIRSSDEASKRNLAIVAGTQRRHDPAYIETIHRIHDGEIGKVLAAQVYWNQGGLWNEVRQPAWSDAEWQLRNWLYFTWASGDHIVEQHVHNLDVANWVIDALPEKAVATGGRQSRTAPEYGHVFDHFTVQYEYPDGVMVTSMCRQQDGTASRVGEHIIGSHGTSNARSRIDSNSSWVHQGANGVNPYVEEHRDLVESIREGSPLNEGRRIAESTLTAIMGREAAYTGQEITWAQLIASAQNIGPAPFALGAMQVPAVAMPGQTRLARTFSEGW